MGVLSFKLKTTFGTKKCNDSNEFSAPKKYDDFIKKCEQLYSINYNKDIAHAIFYDKDKKEYLVKNKNDYEQFCKIILNRETLEVKLISVRAIKKDYDGYIVSDEEIDTIIDNFDEQYNVKELFEDNVIRDAIIKSKGDINKAQEILFE